jgi:hypothetical protein
MIDAIAELFPRFARLAVDRGLEHVLPPATREEVASLESRLGIALPQSYKGLLQCARGFWLLGGVLQFGVGHPFFHEFKPLEKLTPQQQQSVRINGGRWPPPSQGMLCFAEFFMEADGDQVLFDVRKGFIRGEYPVVYYAHEERPPLVRQIASSFGEFMEGFLEYPAFGQQDKD